MMENNRIFEATENGESDIKLIEVHCSPVLPQPPNAPKRPGNSIRRTRKNRKDERLVVKKIEFPKEIIPIPWTSINEKSADPGAAEIQYGARASTSALQPRVPQQRNYCTYWSRILRKEIMRL